ncbi:MAG: hypothetical protein ABFD60_09220 [Bryobacteraceae bacterium]
MTPERFRVFDLREGSARPVGMLDDDVLTTEEIHHPGPVGTGRF